MEQIAATLLTWIAMNSGYPIADIPLPKIVVLSPPQMTSLYHRVIGSEQRVPEGEHRVLGHFEPRPGRQGTVFIVDPSATPNAKHFADPSDNLWFRERLRHELVHYVQHYTGAYSRFECIEQGEYDAYVLGGRYLADRGVQDLLPGRMLLARQYSDC